MNSYVASREVESLDALLAAAPARLAPRAYRLLPAGAATPAGVYNAAGPAPYRLLLESSAPGPPLGRYSFLTGDPLLCLWHHAGQTYLHAPGWPTALSWAGDPFFVLQGLAARYREAPGAAATPFPAGAAGYLGYSLRRWIEPVLTRPLARPGLPECWLGIYDSTCTFDHAAGLVIISGPAGDALDRWSGALSRAAPGRPPPPRLVPPTALGRSFGPDGYQAAVRIVQQAIASGAIYQANLSQRFIVPCPDDGWTIYRRLQATNPAPFAAYLPLPGASIVSASPERFLQLAGSRVETRPIKGTRPRGATPEADQALAAELQASVKDRAENVMIVDLMRNDLGRVCTIGSVRVPELLALESYPSVHHLVSTVTGTLAPGRDAVDLLRACWPGGSITGAPKIRAMQIIAELEAEERGIYCGSIGYLSVDGTMDTNIAIRTLAVAGGQAILDAGGGIVADSDPVSEYQETIDKAAALLRALGVDPAALDSGAHGR